MNDREFIDRSCELLTTKVTSVLTHFIKNEVVPNIRKMESCEITDFSESKSIFMMIAATQNPMKGSASTFITDCYKKIDKDNEYFKGIKNFISKAIENKWEYNKDFYE